MTYITSSIQNIGSMPLLQASLSWLAVISLCTFFLSLILIPWIIGKLPQDYFVQLNEKKKNTHLFSSYSFFLAILRNGFGVFLLTIGIIMLFLPGQGILTILVGLLLLSFPGKKRLIANLTGQPKLQRSMDWIRKKRQGAPFIWPKTY